MNLQPIEKYIDYKIVQILGRKSRLTWVIYQKIQILDRLFLYKCAFLILLTLFCCRIYQTKDELSIFPDLTQGKPKTKFLFAIF